MSMAETEEKIAILKENGMQVSAPSEELARGLREIGETMADEWRASAGDVGAAILSAYSAR
jgi:TRAP-type C4-dicarboxylate transport system substrate-binding protein